MRYFFFFKQKTAYELRISDWSSDVCSSDLHVLLRVAALGSAGQDGHERQGEHDRGEREEDVEQPRDGGRQPVPEVAGVEAEGTADHHPDADRGEPDEIGREY